jgi:hypothetical protein
VELRFDEHRLLESHWGITLQFKDGEDLRIKTLLLEHPFYAEDTRWGASLYVDDGIVRSRKYENGAVSQEAFLPQQHYTSWLALSMGDQTKMRIAAAFTKVATQADRSFLSVRDNISLMNVSFGLLDRTWYKGEFLNNFGRVEDVALGYSANVVLGRDIFPWDDVAKSFIHLSAQWAVGDKRRFYSSGGLTASSYFVGGRAADAILSCNVVQHLNLGSRNTLVNRLSVVYGFNASPGTQLTLGSPNGLRGYPAYQLSGQRQLLLNLEDRMFPDLQAWFLKVGGVLFFDCGTVCGDQANPFAQRFHAGAGFGFRIENEKQQGSGIIRIDIAFNFDTRRIGTLTLSTEQLFSAFSTIGLPVPNVYQ